MIAVSWAVLAFLLGAVPVGQVVARYAADVDLHTVGSGNIGATNVARVVGRGPGLFTLVVDVLKGAVPVLLAPVVAEAPHFPWMCGVLAVVGHCYSPYLRWRGGKGVATSLGVLAAAAPWVALGGLVAWGVTVGVSRRSSVGALVALPTVVGLSVWWHPQMAGWTVLLAAVVLVRHAGNIRRLVAGDELGLTAAAAVTGDVPDATDASQTEDAADGEPAGS